MPRYQAILIDLDGTLADTLSEIGASANAMLRDAGRPEIDDAAVTAAVGEGAPNLVAQVMGADLVGHWLPIYMAHYRRFNGTSATLYPRVLEGLDALRAAHLKIACVTNKPAELVPPLFEWLRVADRFDCIVGGGDTVDRKPLPAPLLLACDRMGVEPAACVMVGDSKNDALAARAAGMVSLTVPYGYPGSGGHADRAEALLERGITHALVSDLVAACEWVVRENEGHDHGSDAAAAGPSEPLA